MRYLKLLTLAAAPLLAFVSLATPLAQAEVAREPSMLLLENGVSTLLVTFLGGSPSTIVTLGGKEVHAESLTASLKGCKNQAQSERDTTLCEVLFQYATSKKEKVACRSESQSGEKKDFSETVLMATDMHMANGETTGKVLVPLALFKVLGQSSGEPAEELVITCGLVKERIKGTFACEVSPGLENIPTTREVTIACGLLGEDQAGPKCELLCEWLSSHPFQANFGNGFEDAAIALLMRGFFNKDIFLDD